MSVRGYTLIEAGVGKARSVGEAVQKISHPDARVLSVDTVTGQYDVIAQLEAADPNQLANLVKDGIQRVEGVERTTTCLSVNLPSS